MAAGEELEKSAGNLLQQLLGPWVAEQGLLWQDNVRVRRLKNQFKILEKVKSIVDDNGVELREVNLKALAPLLEGISLEEEPSLQNMWTNLFVNYIDSAKNLSVIVFPNVLKQLSSSEGKILQYFEPPFYSQRMKPFYGQLGKIAVSEEEINNLARLSLIQEETELNYHGNETRIGSIETKVEVKRTGVYVLTDFGKDFLEACHR